MKYIKRFENKENLPNQEMIEWYELETNHIDDSYDDLEQDIEFSRIQRDFLETFSDDLSNLDYFGKLDIFGKLY